jgi:GAF domain-containing protein
VGRAPWGSHSEDREPPARGAGWTGGTINDQLLTAIREFTGTILNPFDLDELLHRLTRQATAVVDAVGAGIMLIDDRGELGFVAASSQLVVEAERHQHQVRQGACHEAHATNRVVVVDDLTTDGRWPDYTPRVLQLGLRAVLGVPMNAHGQTIGVINVYRDAPTTWTADDLATAEILAAMGAGYILNSNQLRAQHALAEQLAEAVASRDLIGQAKGILMAELGLDADGAFELLRNMSQSENRKLRDVARTVVKERRRTRSAATERGRPRATW